MDNISEAVNLNTVLESFITLAFVVGAVANTVALWILHKSWKNRNSKHVLMLRCLAANDLVAQFGMLFLMHMKGYHQLIPRYWQCVLYVCLRAFGIGSGCVALVMAVERWIALTRPFLYQTGVQKINFCVTCGQAYYYGPVREPHRTRLEIEPGFTNSGTFTPGNHSLGSYEGQMSIWEKVVTYNAVRKSIFILWSSAILLTYLPLFGFGLYYDNGKCKRYRDAAEVKDISYAYIFLLFGSTISLCIVLCNISVICELRRIGPSQNALIRRYSRSTVNNKYSTAEEISFAKLMAVVCIIFIFCWMPQMVSIPVAQFYPESKFYKILGKIADLLMCAYFALDPYVYVLQRYLGKKNCRLPCSKPSKMNNSSRSTSVNGTVITTTAININLNNFSPFPEPM